MPEKAALAKFTITDRHKKGESQFTYAEKCGVSTEYLSLIEREKANPSLETLQRIAAYSGATVAEILTVHKSNNSESQKEKTETD